MKYYTRYLSLSINCESPRAGTPMSFNSPDPPFSSHLKRLGAIIQREGGGVKVIIREKGGKCASVLIHLSACVASIICTYVHMCICPYVHMSICTYEHRYICTYVHMSICTGCSKVFIFSAIPVLHLFICFVNAITQDRHYRIGGWKKKEKLCNFAHVWLIRKSMSCAPPLPLLSLRYHQRRDQTNGSNRHSRPGENPSYAIETELVL